MEKGFSIRCNECGEEMVLNETNSNEASESKITISVLGSYPFQSLLLVCTHCKDHDIEVDC